VSGPLPESLRVVTVPASWAYRLGVAWRNRRFDRGVNVKAVDRPVISVGNLSVGGVGKTPMVTWLAEMLHERNHHPVIVMRGYAAGSGQSSDEHMEYAARLPDVPVLADPDRAAALAEFLPRRKLIDCVLMDDGFQHRNLRRNLDLVLIDATRPPFDDRLLPAGLLREPATALRRAGAVVVTHAREVDQSLSAAVRQAHGKGPIAWCDHAWAHLRLFDRKAADQPVPAAWLSGKRVVTLLGIGNPTAVQDQVREAGGRLALSIPARDHQRYDARFVSVVKRRCAGMDVLLTTSKDWGKLRSLIEPDTWPCPIVVPHLSLVFREGEAALRDLVLATVNEPVVSSAEMAVTQHAPRPLRSSRDREEAI